MSRFFTVMPAFDAAGGACTANRCETWNLPGPEGGATTGENTAAASTPGLERRVRLCKGTANPGNRAGE